MTAQFASLIADRYEMPSARTTGKATLDITRSHFTSFVAITVGKRVTHLEIRTSDLDDMLKALGYERPPF